MAKQNETRAKEHFYCTHKFTWFTFSSHGANISHRIVVFFLFTQ